MEIKTYHCFLGRFAPLHLGHQKMIDSLIKKYGENNLLLLIGSSNSYNLRTPYAYEERLQMIKAVYPAIAVRPLPDIQPELVFFDGSTNQFWLDNLKKIEKAMNAKFIFYGGCQADLDVLREAFETHIFMDRAHAGHGFSATQVRQALEMGDEKTLSLLLHPSVLPLAKAGFSRYKSTL